MEVIKYLKNNTIQDLQNTYAINVKEYDNFWVLNYDQIDSHHHKFHQIVKECRALILDKNTLEPLSRSFERFYNLMEDPEYIQNKTKYFDIKKSKCYEKIDGSLINLWWNPYSSVWQFSTRGMAYAEGPTPGCSEDSELNITFKDVIEVAVLRYIPEDVLKFINSRDFNIITNYIFSSLNKDYTYICELTSPMTRVVKSYKEIQLYYLSHKNNKTGEEIISLSRSNLNTYANIFKKPEVYTFDSLDSISEAIANLPSMDEGYVCCWDDPYIPNKINRVKIKNPAYLAIANIRMNGAISRKRAAYLVMTNNETEYLSYFPEDMYAFKNFIEAREMLLTDIPLLYNNLKSITSSQKEFAIILQNMNSPFFGLLFNMYKGLTFEESLKQCIYGKNHSNKQKSAIEKEIITNGSVDLLSNTIIYYKRLYRNKLIEILNNVVINKTNTDISK